jgi:hypothetical protein
VNSTGAFLRSDERRWVSSNLFFMCINRLDLNDKIYHIPAGVTVSNEELTYYVDHLIDQLGAVKKETPEEYEAYNYVMMVANMLKSWVKGGYGAKVV